MWPFMYLSFSISIKNSVGVHVSCGLNYKPICFAFVHGHDVNLLTLLINTATEIEEEWIWIGSANASSFCKVRSWKIPYPVMNLISTILVNIDILDLDLSMILSTLNYYKEILYQRVEIKNKGVMMGPWWSLLFIPKIRSIYKCWSRLWNSVSEHSEFTLIVLIYVTFTCLCF